MDPNLTILAEALSENGTHFIIPVFSCIAAILGAVIGGYIGARAYFKR